MGGADGIGSHAHARDSSLWAAPSAQNNKVLYLEAHAFFVILRSAATKDLARARYHISMGQSLRFGL